MVDDHVRRRDSRVFVQWLYNKRISIRRVTLRGSFNVRDEEMDMLSSACIKLQSLDLRKNGEVTDVGISRLSEGCHRLHTLDLSKCSLVTDVSISRLSEGSLMLHMLSDECLMKLKLDL